MVSTIDDRRQNLRYIDCMTTTVKPSPTAESPPLYPVFLNLQGKTALVVGAGNVGRRKLLGLLAAKANVRVVSLEPQPSAYNGLVDWHQESYDSKHLTGVSFVVAAATPDVNRTVVSDSKKLGLWVNSSSDSDIGDASIPATLREGPIQVAVGTHGASPILAKKLRDELGNAIDPAYRDWATLLSEFRPLVIDNIADPQRRKEILQELNDDSWIDRLRENDYETVRREMRTLVERHSRG
jgi:precorrin-2 dehydrogenase / sirohydrochlorin ferrochelatase